MTVSLSSNAMTLADWSKLYGPDGKLSTIANLLAQSNEVLDDMVFLEANGPTYHRVSVATGLPPAYWRSFNMGVPSAKGSYAQVDESMGILEAFSTMDKDLAELNGDVAIARFTEDQLFLESMNQQMSQAVFYGAYSNDVRQVMGLQPRYNTLSSDNGQNILDGGGTSTTNTSIWLVVWGENTVFCPFPKGSKAGLQMEDFGVQIHYDANGNQYPAYKTRFQWKAGLCVKDWRYVVRIANINVASTGTAITADLLSLMSRALDRIPNLRNGRAAFYMNRTVFSWLRLQALAKSNHMLSIEDGMSQFGTPYQWTKFMGVPLKRVDMLLNTEAQVTTGT
jgi:hypothetical protein